MNNWSYNPGFLLMWFVVGIVVVCWLQLPSQSDLLVKAAAQFDTNRIIEMIRAGAQVNHRLKSTGKTPLMQAAAKGKRANVELLLRMGADPESGIWREELPST